VATFKQADFTKDEDWYQAYVRYSFPRLRGKQFNAYLRVGISYVPADLRFVSRESDPESGLPVYQQDNATEDFLGNIGFGVTYYLHQGRRANFGLQLEGEGFYGHRWQDCHEILPGSGVDATTSVENDLYGGIGRLTARFEYRLGRSGLLRLFADAGMAVKYSAIDYSDNGLGTHDELLWGPYVKAGLRYSF
jgi:hypothetical protein